MALQAVFGFIPRIYGKGRSAKQMCEYMMNMRREMQAAELELSVPPQFDTLIILDRQVGKNSLIKLQYRLILIIAIYLLCRIVLKIILGRPYFAINHTTYV